MQHTVRNPEDWDEILQALESDVEAERVEAEAVLLRSGAETLHDLVRSLQAEAARTDWDMSRRESLTLKLLRFLARCDDPHATEVLCELLQNPQSFGELNIITVLFEALGDRQDARAVPVIVALLEPAVQFYSLLAVDALGKIGHRSALPELRRLLSWGITFGSPVIDSNWVSRVLTAQIYTYGPDHELRAAVERAIATIEESPPEIADCPIPATAPPDPESDDLPRPVE